jgi:hypothetical protein
LALRLNVTCTGGAFTFPTAQMSQGKGAAKIHVTIFCINEGNTENFTKLHGVTERAKLASAELDVSLDRIADAQAVSDVVFMVDDASNGHASSPPRQ